VCATEIKKRYATDVNEVSYDGLTEVCIIHAKTNTVKKLFTEKPWLVLSLRYAGNGEWAIYPALSRLAESGQGSYILKEQLLFTAIGTDTNGDGVLGADDVRCLFFCTKTGEDLRQLTPPGLSVVNMTISADFRYIMLTAKQDQNKNGELNDDDELLYKIELDKDIAKIKLVPIPVQ